jgi:hypothetical protein
LSKGKARFTFRATAVLHESADRSHFEIDPHRENDTLAYHLRLLSCYPQPPQIVDAHHLLRKLNESIVSPTAHDIEEQEDSIIYHARDFALSRTPREFLFSVPFAVDTGKLTLAANCALVDAARGAMSITPPRVPWAYAAQFALMFASVPETPYLVEIECSVTRGKVGMGILNKKEDDFIYRLAVPATKKRLRVHLPIEDADAVGRFVIQTWDSPAEAHVDINGITLLSDAEQHDPAVSRTTGHGRPADSQRNVGGRYDGARDWRMAVARIRRLTRWRPRLTRRQ